ncbi:hypothetical protein C4E04_11785 [Microvirga sp. 17 mud 1-3]|nr:hypothetical protein C4E04_11785 [Microvirga sp. 17 mud 1-3]
MARYHCRCRKCEARRVLPRHPDDYLRPPRCACGAKSWRIDRWMNTRDTSMHGAGCNCSGYWFTHRRGSKFCWYRKDGTARVPGDPDFSDRELSADEIAAAAAQIKDAA